MSCNYQPFMPTPSLKLGKRMDFATDLAILEWGRMNSMLGAPSMNSVSFYTEDAPLLTTAVAIWLKETGGLQTGPKLFSAP